jgi:nucleoside phosphorylase
LTDRVAELVERRVDVVILTAIPLEYDEVLKVDAGAVDGSRWEEARSEIGLPVAFRRFTGTGARPLRVAVAVAPDMGAPAAVATLLPLIEWLEPRCIAMCGVCAGRPDKGVLLGDVIAADQVFYHDTFLPDLAGSLNNLSIMLSEVGQRDSALNATREAVEAYRALAAQNPDAFLPGASARLPWRPPARRSSFAARSRPRIPARSSPTSPGA